MTAQQKAPDFLRVAHPPLLSRALGWLANPAHRHHPRQLRAAVTGKIVLVTGASYGLGEATAKLLAAAGAIVLLVARTREKQEDVADDIRIRGGIAHIYATDLSDVAQVQALADTVLREHGHVDILVSNAGKSIRRSATLSYERFCDYERTNAINYLGPVRLVLALLPSMQARHTGHIINISTVGVRTPPAARWAAYQASKTAFDVWLRSVALEVEQFGIRTSTLYMGLIYTRMSAPTPIFHRMPGLHPEQAAHLVERAIISHEASISPPWLAPAEILSTAWREPTRHLMRRLYRLTHDTRSATAAVRSRP